jgi:putative transcriptional regulator
MIIKCDCGGEYKTLTGQTYHYEKALSGLDDVYLENMTVDHCQQCGDISPVFHKLPQLHKAIARAIVLRPHLLTGSEIRFLRKERGLKAKDFADLLRVDPSTLSRWENDEQPRTLQNDALVRAIYVLRYNEQEQQPFPEPVTNKFAIVDSSQNRPSIVINTASFINQEKLAG